MSTPRRALAASLTVLALTLGGCSATSGPFDLQAPGGAAGAPAAPVTDAAPKTDAAQDPGETSDAERKVARTATLTVKIADPERAAADARAVVAGLGGFVSSERIVTEQRDGYYLRPSTVTISVPSARLDEALTELGKLGTVTDRVVTATDVTAKVVDVDARVRTLRASIARTEALMARAGSVAEIAQVEAELTKRQSELESMLAQQKALADRVAMSTVTVTLSPNASVAQPNPLLQGLTGGWEALLLSLRMILTLLGGVLPFAAIALALWLPIRAWRRRRRAAAQRPATGSAPDQAATDRPATDQAASGGAQGSTPSTGTSGTPEAAHPELRPPRDTQ